MHSPIDLSHSAFCFIHQAAELNHQAFSVKRQVSFPCAPGNLLSERRISGLALSILPAKSSPIAALIKPFISPGERFSSNQKSGHLIPSAIWLANRAFYRSD